METLDYILMRSSFLRKILLEAFEHVRSSQNPYRSATFPMPTIRLQDELQPTIKLEKASHLAQIAIVVNSLPLLRS